MVCIDIYAKKKHEWFDEYNCRLHSGKNQNYYTLKVSKNEYRKVLKRVKKLHCKYRVYEEQWGRSNSYRQSFFKSYAPPYRCRYCGKFLKKEYMEVDHIVPASKTKYSKRARAILKRRGINNVNDVRNLVPSCKRCNKIKSDRMGIWVLRGFYGDQKWFKVMYFSTKIFFLFFITYLLYTAYMQFKII